MGCRLRRLPRSGKLALSLQWVLGGRSLRTQEALGVADTVRNRAVVERDFVAPIAAEMRARRFDEARYLHWFPSGARAADFRRRLGQRTGGQAGPRPVLVRDYYRTWVERAASHARPAQVRDYRQHMTAYVLPGYGDHALADLRVGHLLELRTALAERGLAPKTQRNIIDGTFRAFYRDARREELVSGDPFAQLDWRRLPRTAPDPFSLDERDRILAWFEAHDGGRYYGFMSTLLLTGLRPSEAVALRVGDIDLERRRLAVCRSRYLGDEHATKTAASERTVPVVAELADTLRREADGRDRGEYLFRNRFGRPINQSEWPKDHWRPCLDDLGIRYRRWYTTRHTFISLALTAGANLFGLARYVGSSPQMIEQRYGRYMPANERELLQYVDEPRRKTRPATAAVAFSPKKPLRIKASPTGFEPHSSRHVVIPIFARKAREIRWLPVPLRGMRAC